jgi:uncharacterized membrane protein YraQ (UPF0718 family)
MLDVIVDTLLDGLKLLPFLFLAFLIIELIEHKLSKKSKQLISKSNKFGPLIGSLLGVIPQCGFSVMATNLYVTRIISLGTLIAIYLSTSDEMLPILLSENADINVIIEILLIKFFIGLVCGFVIDLIYRNRKKEDKMTYDICDKEHCHCDKENLFVAAIKHTFNTLIFIMLISFVLNTLLYYVGEDSLAKIFLKNSIFGPFIASLVGLIPNCGASVMITELYLNNAISLGSTIAGLLTGSGVALLVLFKSNKNLKENFTILFIIYAIGVLSGMMIEIINTLI